MYLCCSLRSVQRYRQCQARRYRQAVWTAAGVVAGAGCPPCAYPPPGLLAMRRPAAGTSRRPGSPLASARVLLAGSRKTSPLPPSQDAQHSANCTWQAASGQASSRLISTPVYRASALPPLQKKKPLPPRLATRRPVIGPCLFAHRPHPLGNFHSPHYWPPSHLSSLFHSPTSSSYPHHNNRRDISFPRTPWRPRQRPRCSRPTPSHATPARLPSALATCSAATCRPTGSESY